MREEASNKSRCRVARRGAQHADHHHRRCTGTRTDAMARFRWPGSNSSPDSPSVLHIRSHRFDADRLTPDGSEFRDNHSTADRAAAAIIAEQRIPPRTRHPPGRTRSSRCRLLEPLRLSAPCAGMSDPLAGRGCRSTRWTRLCCRSADLEPDRCASIAGLADDHEGRVPDTRTRTDRADRRDEYVRVPIERCRWRAWPRRWKRAD